VHRRAVLLAAAFLGACAAGARAQDACHWEDQTGRYQRAESLPMPGRWGQTGGCGIATRGRYDAITIEVAGRPAGGAEVRNRDGSKVWATADPTGVVRDGRLLTGVENDRCRVWLDGRRLHFRRWVEDDRLELWRGDRTVRVRLEDDDRVPISGATLRLSVRTKEFTRLSWTASTDESGVAEWPGVSPSSSSVECIAGGAMAGLEGAVIPERERYTYALLKGRRASHYTFDIRDAEGEPFGGVVVGGDWADPYRGWWRTKTRGEGRNRVRIPRGADFRLRAIASARGGAGPAFRRAILAGLAPKVLQLRIPRTGQPGPPGWLAIEHPALGERARLTTSTQTRRPWLRRPPVIMGRLLSRPWEIHTLLPNGTCRYIGACRGERFGLKPGECGHHSVAALEVGGLEPGRWEIFVWVPGWDPAVITADAWTGDGAGTPPIPCHTARAGTDLEIRAAGPDGAVPSLSRITVEALHTESLFVRPAVFTYQPKYFRPGNRLDLPRGRWKISAVRWGNQQLEGSVEATVPGPPVTIPLK
jgi:hypothetical protein